LRDNNTAYSFGDNTFGQLGINNITEIFIPSFIMKDIIQITSGFYHSLILNIYDKIFSFGSNSNGQLGLNLPLFYNISIPTEILFPINQIKSISCGNFHCLVLNTTGSIYSFGMNNVNLF
jgi:E3 ubiquitin-protein ligase HERC4